LGHLPPKTRVLLVDDQPLFRRALATLIGGQFDMTVVGEGENGRDALEKVRALHPDLVVMDVNMPDADGVEGVTAIRAAGFTTPIVMLTVSEDDDDLFNAIKAGANGYMLKNVRPEDLFEALRGVMRGESPIAPAVASKLLEALRTGGIPSRGPGGSGGPGGVPGAGAEDTVLTRRESEILQLVAAGMSNKEIANELTITEGTVKNHVHNALEKLHLTNRVQAAAYAVRQGMTGPDAPKG
jgi:DNA-binding NarL/FixJ family response regulator